MSELTWHDLSWVLRRTPPALLELMKKEGDKIIVAGGFIRSCVAQEPVNDVDVFSPTQADAEKYAQVLSKGYPVFKTDNAFTLNKTFKVPVQFIHRWTYTKPEDVVDSFDFTIAKAAFWWKDNWQSLTDSCFYSDLAAKRLIYTSPQRNEDAGGSILRVLKFYQRGYRMPLDSLGAVIARLVAGLDLDAIASHSDKEAQMAKVLTGLLREVDPNVDPEHIAHLPSLEQVRAFVVEHTEIGA